jgi:hypothetical protein
MKPTGWLQRLGAVALSVLFAGALLETGLRLLVAGGVLHVPRAASDDPFWDGRHPVFGVWHAPRVSATHRTPCFDVAYHANSVGARDVERRRGVDGPRVVLLGDSYFEGWGLAEGQRVGDLLERATGVEHINLAMSHFGPFQEFLAYRDLGEQYAHTAVVIGIYPMNDFFDLDYEVAKNSPGYYYRYRPYLVGDYPDYQVLDYREGPLHRFLRKDVFAFNVLDAAYDRFRTPVAGFDAPPSFQDRSGQVHSFFYDYSDRQFLLLRASLERLVDAARGKKVVVVLIPSPPDFLRFHQAGSDRLARDLAALDALKGETIVDLLPEMYRRSTDWSEFYFTCDVHWNALGHWEAARILLDRLTGPIYPPAGSPPLPAESRIDPRPEP